MRQKIYTCDFCDDIEVSCVFMIDTDREYVPVDCPLGFISNWKAVEEEDE